MSLPIPRTPSRPVSKEVTFRTGRKDQVLPRPITKSSVEQPRSSASPPKEKSPPAKRGSPRPQRTAIPTEETASSSSFLTALPDDPANDPPIEPPKAPRSWGKLRGNKPGSSLLSAALQSKKEEVKAEHTAEMIEAAKEELSSARLRAKEASKLGDWAQAEAEISEVLDKVRISDPGLYLHRAKALRMQRRDEDALEDAERALIIEPNSPRANYSKARALSVGRQWSEAGGAFLKSLERSPRDDNVDRRYNKLLFVMRSQARPFWAGKGKTKTEKVLEGGRLTAFAPAVCEKCVVKDETSYSLAVSWAPPQDDGGDEIYQYELQIAFVDPLSPDDHNYSTVYEGLEPLHFVVDDLDANSEWLLRVRAVNQVGAGTWSEPTVAATLMQKAGERTLDTNVPESWLELKANMDDLFVTLRKKWGANPEANWKGIVDAWRNHIPTIRLAFRLFVLLGSKETDPQEMTLTQFRVFVDNCAVFRSGLRGAGSKTVETDLIFTRVNREASTEGKKANASKGDNKMGQAEFVHAIVRLGLSRCELQRGEAGTVNEGPWDEIVASLGECFERIMAECVGPNATFEMNDELSTIIQGRGVKAALGKHNEALKQQYLRWSGADKAVGASASTMNLSELMMALKEAKILDTKCTAREVTSFFVRVNADDEIYVAEGGGKKKGKKAENASAAELDFDEFCEITCRICNEKIPAEVRGDTPFENTLDNWLGLAFVPALRNAGKGVVLEQK